MDSSEIASVVRHVERLLSLITSCRVSQTMSDTSVSSKWWVVQLALEHRICILGRALARNFAILNLDVVMLGFFLVTIFKIGCVTLVGEQILCFSLCL